MTMMMTARTQVKPQIRMMMTARTLRQVKPMFMSDFEMVYFLQPHFTRGHAPDAALFRSVCQVASRHPRPRGLAPRCSGISRGSLSLRRRA